jgi:uncharacterized GH25 family protein
MKPRLSSLWMILFGAGLCGVARAHDTWVQTNTNLVRTGDAVQVDLMLGNHGNDHRDFKLAGKPDFEASTVKILAPGGTSYDIKDRLTDNGYAPSEGFWTGRFVAAAPGLYLVAHTCDKVVSYAPLRSIKSAKAFFVVSPSLDRVSPDNPGFDQVLGHPLELVPTVNPVTPMGPGKAIGVRVLYQGKPLLGARVAFVPRGVTLNESFDDRYERTTDEQGKASFTPREGNAYLVVVHHVDPTAGGKGHEGTKYSATLTVYVPQLCPCWDAIEN